MIDESESVLTEAFTLKGFLCLPDFFCSAFPSASPFVGEGIFVGEL